MNIDQLARRNAALVVPILRRVERLPSPLWPDLVELARDQAVDLGLRPDTGRKTLNDLEQAGILRISRTTRAGVALTGFGRAWLNRSIDDIPVLAPWVDDQGTEHHDAHRLIAWRHYLKAGYAPDRDALHEA